MVLHPGVQFKSVEGDALPADRDSGEVFANLRVEPIAVHAEVERRVTQANESRQ
jgi:hypothetical protein